MRFLTQSLFAAVLLSFLMLTSWGAAQPVLPQPPSTKAIDEEDSTTNSPQAIVANRASLTEPQPPALAPQLLRTHHPWGRFDPGAWRTVRITTETFDPTGRFIGRTETNQTETLQQVDDKTYTIEITSVVEVGGKRLRGASQTVTRQLLTDQPMPIIEATPLEPTNIALDGAMIPCQQWQVVYGEGADRRIETICYSPDRSPYVLRRQSMSVEPLASAGEAETLPPAKSSPTVASVTRVDAPVLIEDGIAASSHLSITSQAGENRIERFEILCDATPGGLVSASSTERDASGRRVRWTATELVEFGQSAEPQRPRRRWFFFGRRGQSSE